MLCSARDAIHIPSRSTAHWIESADDVAACGVIATGRCVRNAALAAARATCDGVADALRDVDAVCVPTELAADGLDFANSGAAELIGAARFRMDKEFGGRSQKFVAFAAQVSSHAREQQVGSRLQMSEQQPASEQPAMRLGTPHGRERSEPQALPISQTEYALSTQNMSHCNSQHRGSRMHTLSQQSGS